jgi:hypothetical protein
MDTELTNTNEGLMVLIKNLQSNRTYKKFKERRMASPYFKEDLVVEGDDDQKKWDDLIDTCLSRMEEDALL